MHAILQCGLKTGNRKQLRAAAKPAACAKPLMLSTLGREGGIYVGKKGGKENELGKEVGRESKERGRERQRGEGGAIGGRDIEESEGGGE